jgi:Peptidase family M23
MAKVIAVILIGVAACGVILLALSTHSGLTFNPQPKVIGISTPVTVHIANPHGIRRITAIVEQEGTSTPLSEDGEAATRFMFWRADRPPREFRFVAGQSKAPALKEGRARVVVEAQSNDLRGTHDTISAEVQVVLRPPSITTDGFQHYINQGGSELAIFTPSGSWNEAGIRVRGDTFRSFPLPGNPNQRFALFAYGWDTPAGVGPLVYARNAAGNEATGRFWFKVFPKRFRKRDLTIDDAFLNKVVNQIDPTGSGELLTRFLKINGELRRKNNQTLMDLRLKSDEKFLWTQSFLQLANSQVESEFADVRSYMYQGKKVDQQVHLGFDLAVGQHTPVIAANDGRIVWAAPLGIYGNCIVVDHGYGLQSIYGHLSEIGVKEGEMVRRGQPMGKSGSTGLASGDHLHFSMQIDGVQVNPIEWWDEHWIKDHIRNRINVP